MTLYNNLFEKYNENFIGSATMSVLGQSILGSIAAMNILANGTSLIQMIQLGILVLICMLANTSILAQMKHRFIFNIVIISIISSTIFIIINNL